MDKQEARQIEVEAIAPNPANPRKGFDGRGFDELVASIREKGIIQPIVVRIKPTDDKAYEIVVGERRWRAATAIGLDTVPAIVKTLSDEEAYEIMLIENLQRQDLSPMEEAAGFRDYIKARGEDGIRELAQRTGVAERYVRGRVAVLDLPEKVVKAWTSGKLAFGHLEQLLRVKNDPARLKESVRFVLEKDRWNGLPAVHDLKGQIDRYSATLSRAPFLDEKCKVCLKNSQVQKSLFDVGSGEKSDVASCLDPKCFKSRLNEWLSSPENWEKSEYRKKFKTNGFRFSDGLEWNKFQSFYRDAAPRKKCATCASLITIIDNDGDVRQNLACIGEKSCATAEQKKAGGKSAKKERKPGEARVPWHGEYFRDLFFRERLPQVIEKLNPEDEKMKVLKLIAIMKKDYNVMRKVATATKFVKGEVGWVDDPKVLKHLLALPYKKIEKLFGLAAQEVIMDGGSRGGGFGLPDRRLIAEYLGIDVGKEWTMTEEYVEKNTTAELNEIIVSQKLYAQKKFNDYLAQHFKKTDPKKCKKGELVEAILKSGIDLVGKVPKEITS